MRNPGNDGDASKVDYVEWVNLVLDHMVRHLDGPLRLEELARVAGFSPFHFHRVFGALMGEREALARLREMGIQTMMLTGDAEAVARWVSGELGLDDYFAEVLPHEKSEKVREVKRRGLTIAMIGDGVNDAPALVASDVGIAIGAGTDVAIESADIVLVRSDPRDVASVVGLARATYGEMVQNLWWTTGYNVVAIPSPPGSCTPQAFC